MRRIAAVLLIMVISALTALCAVCTDGVYISAETAVLINASTGEELFSRGADKRMQPASMTKIMTALIALEQLGTDTDVTVTPSSVGIEGSSAYLEAGEVFTSEELMYALLLGSANDAAVALAEACGGVERFVGLMNGKASLLGLDGTHFSNPHGLSDKDHYSTARDIARLLTVCMRDPRFAAISGAVRYDITPSFRHHGISLTNHNKLLLTADGVISGKTGYTRSSGRCLCSYYEKDGLCLCAVTMNDPRDWEDHKALYGYGESLYQRVRFDVDEVYGLHIVGGLVDHIDCTLERSFTVAVRRGARIEKTIMMRRFEYAPVAAGEQVGVVVWTADGEILHTEKLYSDNKAEAEKNDFGDIFRWRK